MNDDTITVQLAGGGEREVALEEVHKRMDNGKTQHTSDYE